MKTVSLFSGAGGMDLGARAAGADIVFATDRLADARETYRRCLSEVPFELSDISRVDKIPDAELVLGGYPCRPFSLGGARKPSSDDGAWLYKEFARIVEAARPAYFVAENVGGLSVIDSARWLKRQLRLFAGLGAHGYNLTHAVLRAEEYGVAQKRRRLFIVGVRGDLGVFYCFPPPTHGTGRLTPVGHGDVISGLPLWPQGEFYERPGDDDGEWPWYYMSRNRKARWEDPSKTLVASWRHTPLHPASPAMRLVWSRTYDGSKQRWEFTDGYDHLEGHPKRPRLERPRRLSWRECALLQGFSGTFEPAGSTSRKFELIGNAVPPPLSEAVLRPLVSGSGFHDFPCDEDAGCQGRPGVPRPGSSEAATDP